MIPLKESGQRHGVFLGILTGILLVGSSHVRGDEPAPSTPTPGNPAVAVAPAPDPSSRSFSIASARWSNVLMT